MKTTLNERILLSIILIMVLMAIIGFVFAPPSPILVTLKANQTALISPATFCEDWIVTEQPTAVTVTCRVWVNGSTYRVP